MKLLDRGPIDASLLAGLLQIGDYLGLLGVALTLQILVALINLLHLTLGVRDFRLALLRHLRQRRRHLAPAASYLRVIFLAHTAQIRLMALLLLQQLALQLVPGGGLVECQFLVDHLPLNIQHDAVAVVHGVIDHVHGQLVGPLVPEHGAAARDHDGVGEDDVGQACDSHMAWNMAKFFMTEAFIRFSLMLCRWMFPASFTSLE